MDLINQFKEAVANSKTLHQKPDNDILLKLYGLFKQATEGDNGQDGPVNSFDFVAKFKHEAWAKLKGLTNEAAMQQYIDLVNQLKG